MSRMLLTRLWVLDDPFGAELAEISLDDGTLLATGVAVRSEPVPYRLEYDLATTDRYITRRLSVRSSGSGWRRSLVLERSANGEWKCATETAGEVDLEPAGGDVSRLSGALDCDLGLSPLTNSMPVLRHQLHRRAEQIDFRMAWVAVPGLTVTPSPQRYTFVQPSTVRYESLDSDFTAEITFDEHGIVLDYPGIARTVSTARAFQQP